MKEKKILFLTVTKKWFDKIVNGEKDCDFREIKPYWISRLMKKEFFNSKNSSAEIFREYDFVVIRNGYAKTAPTIKKTWAGTSISFGGDLGNFLQFRIRLENI
jgi:hypothetical protein